MRVKMDFMGGALPLFGYMLIATILSMFVIPAAWGAVLVYAWIAKNITLSDNSTVAFKGRGGEIWWAFVLNFLASNLSTFVQLGLGRDARDYLGIIMALNLVGLLASLYFSFLIFRWFVESVQFSWGGNLSFNGSFLGFLGYALLVGISMLLIVVWAWVISAWVKWMLDNTSSSTGEKFIWTGDGLNILWRTIVMTIACCFIIPIPWAARWYIRWFIQNIEISKAEAAPGVQPLTAPVTT